MEAKNDEPLYHFGGLRVIKIENEEQEVDPDIKVYASNETVPASCVCMY